MPLSFTPVEPGAEPVEPRDSATVVVARDGDRGIEVFMLERHLKSDFAGGAYVFPGGTLDERDCDPALAEVTDGLPADPVARYGGPAGAGYAICAIRETFEEAGILLATRGGEPVTWSDDEEDAFADARRLLASGALTPLDFARKLDLRFAAGAMRYFSRWITPAFAPRRYDARFFVAAMPAGQRPIHDDVETTASTWVRPADALERAAAGELSIIFPTRKILESLGAHATVDALLAACEGLDPHPILPKLVVRDGQPKVVLPPDPTEHDP